MCPRTAASPLPEAGPWEKLLFFKAVTVVKCGMKFERGSCNNSLFALGSKCYARGLDEERAIELVQKSFGRDDPGVCTLLHNAYICTNRTTDTIIRKEDKQSVINRVADLLQAHCGIHRNMTLDRLELIVCNESSTPSAGYRFTRGKGYNSIFVDPQLVGTSCFQNFLRIAIDSDYAKEFSPFTDCLDGLALWDGTNYIDQLTETVQTEGQPLWTEGSRRRLMGMAACTLCEGGVNQLVIILHSEQGKRKSSRIRHLL